MVTSAVARLRPRLMRSARRSTRGRRTRRSRPRGTAAAPRPSDRRTSTIDPGSTHSPSSGQRLRQPDQRRGRVAHDGAAGRGVDRPAAPEDAAQDTEIDQRVRAGGRGRRATIRAAPALSATESGQAEGLGVAGVHHLDGREHRLGGRQHLSDRGRGLDPLPDQERDLGLRPRVDELVELQRLRRAGTTMPDVSRPKTGSWMPSACRLTRLVSPSFAPIIRSPASRRCSTTSDWAS